MADSKKIIANGFVFTGDAQNHAGRASLLLVNDRISDIGKHPDVLKRLHPDAEIIDASNKVILPGFIDAHFSGESFLLHYFTLGHPSAKWKRVPSIRKSMEYIHETASQEELAAMYRLAYFAALHSGITTVAEFGMDHLDFSFRAAFDSMQRAELRGFIGLHNGDQIEAARTLNDPSIKFALVIENEADITTYGLQSTLRTAKEYQWPIILHLGQTLEGFETIKRNFRTSIVQFYDEYRLFDLPVHIAHLMHYEDNDYTLLAKSKRPLIISPNAIIKKGTLPPPLEELAKHKIPIALGTDWGNPAPFENLRAYSSMLQSLSLPSEKPFSLLAMHTRNAAQALGILSETGSIETGKKADLIFLDASDFRLHGALREDNPEASLRVLLDEAGSHDVCDVIIHGEFYVRERHVLTYAEEDLVRESDQLLGILNSRVAEKNIQVENTSALILPIHSSQAQPTINDDAEIPVEEGFRIIKKGSEATNNTASPIKHNAPELPKNIKRIFGDDDDL
jgi:5-methylthioadenosine/S-adenosylhomocysteine deaminase